MNDGRAQADAWAAWAEARREDDVLALFFDLVPASSRLTLDLGCGEGRLARELRRRGHQVVGVDVSDRLIELARAADPKGTYDVASAERLPFPDRAFDLVVAFNVLMNLDDVRAALTETERVLTDGGQLCFSIVHPLASSGSSRDDAFSTSDYFEERPDEQRVGDLVFANVHRPLEAWSRRLEEAGFVVEAMREPRRPSLPPWDRVPMFLFIRAVKTARLRDRSR